MGATLSMAAYIMPARVSAHQRLITTTKFHLPPQPRQQEDLSLDGAPGPDTETTYSSTSRARDNPVHSTVFNLNGQHTAVITTPLCAITHTPL
jgi:hypothetical protein